MKICFHKWKYLNMDGSIGDKNSCLRYCLKCGYRQSRYTVVGNENYFSLPIPIIKIKWIKLFELTGWKKFKFQKER